MTGHEFLQRIPIDINNSGKIIRDSFAINDNFLKFSLADLCIFEKNFSSVARLKFPWGSKLFEFKSIGRFLSIQTNRQVKVHNRILRWRNKKFKRQKTCLTTYDKIIVLNYCHGWEGEARHNTSIRRTLYREWETNEYTHINIIYGHWFSLYSSFFWTKQNGFLLSREYIVSSKKMIDERL